MTLDADRAPPTFNALEIPTPPATVRAPVVMLVESVSKVVEI